MELNNIDNNMVLIIPNNIKQEVLEYLNKQKHFFNIKLMSFNDIKKSIYFDYDENTILYIMNKYKVKSDIATIYLDNMYYTFGEKISSKKFEFLFNLKEELLANNLLILDKYFSLFFNRKFIVYGFSYIDKFNLNMLKSIPNVEIISNKKNSLKELETIEFSTITDECEYAIRKICFLIESGVDINNIKLTGIDSEYEKELKRLSYFYNIPINFKNNNSIYSTKISKSFLSLLKENLSYEDIISSLKDQYDITNPDNNYIIKKITDICNKYVGLDYDKNLIIELINNDLKKASTNKVNYDNMIEIIDLTNNIIDDNYHVFVLGLNEGKIPTIYKDEEYFSDKELSLMNFSTSTEKNIQAKENLINTLYGIKNLYLSYSLRGSNGELYPSSIIESYNIKVIKKEIERNESYSLMHDKISLAHFFDDYIKYGEKHKDFDLFNNNYAIDYKNYDNSFSGLPKEKILTNLEKLNLAYSSMDNFYRCSFRYYVGNILKLDPYEESFSIFIGNLFHYILSICFNDHFDFDKEWKEYLLKRDLRVDESFFLIRLKKELIFIIDYLKKFNKDTGLNNMLFEKRISIDKSTLIPVEFKGFVDKIMYKEKNNSTMISIIDYKTGSTPINLFNSIYGIGMQLPVYLYLVMKSNIFNNPKIVGIYLQKILNNKITEEDKKDALKLYGYSTSDEIALSYFDPEYENSNYIKGMKKSKNGFYSYTKLLENDDIANLCKLVDEKIECARDAILSGEFNINPKKIGNENVGCSFCKYKDLCYMKEEDIINLKEYKDLSFLGGDNNA